MHQPRCTGPSHTLPRLHSALAVTYRDNNGSTDWANSSDSRALWVCGPCCVWVQARWYDKMLNCSGTWCRAVLASGTGIALPHGAVHAVRPVRTH